MPGLSETVIELICISGGFLGDNLGTHSSVDLSPMSSCPFMHTWRGPRGCRGMAGTQGPCTHWSGRRRMDVKQNAGNQGIFQEIHGSGLVRPLWFLRLCSSTRKMRDGIVWLLPSPGLGSLFTVPELSWFLFLYPHSALPCAPLPPLTCEGHTNASCFYLWTQKGVFHGALTTHLLIKTV